MIRVQTEYADWHEWRAKHNTWRSSRQMRGCQYVGGAHAFRVMLAIPAMARYAKSITRYSQNTPVWFP